MARHSVNEPVARPANSALYRLPAAETAIGIVYFISSVCAIASTRVAGRTALVWPANAIAAALLIRFPRVGFLTSAVTILLAAVAAELIAGGDSSPIAVAMACVNVADTCLMAWAFRSRAQFPVPSITINRAAQMTAVFGFALPALSAIPGGLIMHDALGAPLARSAIDWWLSGAIGACMFGPPIILFSVARVRRLVSRPLLNIALSLLCVVGCFVAIRYLRYPFVAIGVLLMVAAFRLGGFGAAALSLLCGMEVIGLWIFNERPAGLEPFRQAIAFTALPIVSLIATLMPPIAVGLGSDERRRGIRALRLSERQFKESLARSPIGMVIIDMDGIWRITNEAVEQLLGYTQEEFAALPAGSLFDPSDREEIARHWQMLRDGEITSYRAERRFLHKNATWVWAGVAVSLVRDDDGRPLHYIGHIESVEARRRAERELILEQERIKTTLRSIADAVITTDANGCVKYINDAAQELIGQCLADIHSRAFNEVIVLTDPATLLVSTDTLSQCISAARVIRCDRPCVLHRPDGSVCYVTQAITPVIDAEGCVSGMVIVLRDVGENYEREQEIGRRAVHDMLTGLANRFEFQRCSKDVFERARSLAYPAAVLAIDLDRFKAVNDSGGHAAGDAVLRKVATVLKSAIRSSDLVARLGGDEFAIILENCGPVRTAAVGKKILRLLNPLETDWDGTTYVIGASIGVAILDADCADDTAWLTAADQACYEAKRDGRGQIRIA